MFRKLLSLLVVVVLASACSVVNAPDDPTDPEHAGGGGTGLAGPGSGGGGSGGSGGSCTDMKPPSVTSSNVLIPLLASEVSYTLTFDEEVTIEDGGIGISGSAMGATVSSVPALPATAASFELTISGLDLVETYELTVSATAVVDGCGNALAGDFVVPLGEGCGSDLDPPILTSPTVVTLGATDTMTSYMLTFDGPVTLQAGAIALDSGTGSIAVTPSLPATATSFVVDVTGMSGPTVLRLEPALVADVCLNALAQEQYVELCPGGTSGSVTFSYTGNIQQWQVPACVGGPITIVAQGAEGGNGSASSAVAGLGASMGGDFVLQRGDVLKILVGQKPSNNAGGGGSFVTTATNSPLVVAGGGGGGGTIDSSQKNGRTVTAGGSGGGAGGLGGANGSGGSVSNCTHNSAGGGGLTGSGQTGNFSTTPLAAGTSFVAGGSGGGAFGGGGTGSGSYVGAGGGGYSGGGGGCGNTSTTGGVGGGGGSFNAGTNQSNSAGVQSGNGQVTITWN